MANGAFNVGKFSILKGDINLNSDTIKVILVDDTYSFDKDQVTIDNGTGADVQSHEISVSGYVGGFNGAGRKTLAGKSFSDDLVNDRGEFLASDVTWTSLGTGVTIGGAVLVKEVTNDAASIPIAFVDLADTPTNGSNFTITWDAEGILQLS